MPTRLVLLALVLAASTTPSAQSAQRPLALDDHSRLVALGDPQRSPDGTWVADTVTTIDADKDRRKADIWCSGTARRSRG